MVLIVGKILSQCIMTTDWRIPSGSSSDFSEKLGVSSLRGTTAIDRAPAPLKPAQNESHLARLDAASAHHFCRGRYLHPREGNLYIYIILSQIAKIFVSFVSILRVPAHHHVIT